MDQSDEENLVLPRSAGEGKLWIKLKINPVKFKQGGSQSDDHHWIGAPQRNEEPRVCNVCNKGFRSGKALGGHMRVHVQAANKLELKTNSTSTKTGFIAANKTSVIGGDKTVCSLCGKDFPSMKSLFGHMRCHPEREWRGIQPPPQAAQDKNSSPMSSSVSDPEPEEQFQGMPEEEDSVTDLAESLPSWRSKAKRGRKALVTEEEKLFDAVEDLMRLARGDSLESGLTHHNKNRVDDDDDGYCDFDHAERSSSLIEIESKKRRNIEERDCCNQPVKKLRMEKLGKGKAHVLKKEVDEGTNISSAKKKRKKLKLRDVELVGRKGNMIPVDHRTAAEMVAPPPDKYKCSTCSKCFPTHQALGGHRSSHNKVKIISQQNMDDQSSVAACEGDEFEAKPMMSRAEVKKDGEGAGSSNRAVAEESNIDHQCKICNKIFSTGQALRGHKRWHWTGSADQAGVSSQAGCSPGEASQLTGRKILEIDLNELPAMEDEEDGNDCYASNSSHASAG